MRSLVVVVLLGVHARAAPSKYDAAVELLDHFDTWCTGARRLAALKDKRAVIPLVRPFLEGTEANKRCLYDALQALGAGAEARTLIASKDASVRRAAIELMDLFGSDDQLAPLSAAAQADPDPTLRDRARDTVRHQQRTPKWRQLITAMLASPDDHTRGWAIAVMIDDGHAEFRQRLQAHLPDEKNPELRARIQGALAPPRHKGTSHEPAPSEAE
jgi:hypothetical protein